MLPTKYSFQMQKHKQLKQEGMEKKYFVKMEIWWKLEYLYLHQTK